MKNTKIIEEMIEKFDYKIVTLQQLEQIEESELVITVKNIGNSGKYPSCQWYVVEFINGEEISVYIEN